MKIFALDSNYAPHNKAARPSLLKTEPPVVFTKTDSALLKNGKPFFIPDLPGSIDAGGAVVVRLCRLGKTIPVRFAHRYYDAVTLGIDFTARQLLQALQAKGRPWDMAKSFDGAACVGRWVPKEAAGDVRSLRFRIEKDGMAVQEGCTADMLCGIDEAISHVSRFFTIKTGDLLFTGTPSAAVPVAVNDHIRGFIDGIDDGPVLDFRCK